ncbi:MAG: SusC/RagA family TonB-linked outer membrane protein [Bacteroidia bacterium]|nr:SusC/RagA family TonB-linked outer membrane protein [Bacteroidia bacterium]
MKNNFKRILTASSAILLATSVIAQETAEVQPVAADSSLINVAFRTISSQDVLGGIESVNVEQLLEKNYFTGALDNLQAYTSGYNGNSVWGFDSRLVVIDGVAGRDINNVKPDEIASITILKGAQAVLLYGSHAAKGAILVTTKRGKQGDIQIDARANYGLNVFKAFPEYVGAAEQMILYNQARENDGLSKTYSDEEIYKTASGENPYRYPDLNLFSEDYVKKAYNRWDATVEIQGGGEKASYYSQVSYYRIGSPFDFGKAKDNYTDRLSVRGNVDMHLGDVVTAFANANASFYNAKTVNGSGDFWKFACETRANRIQPLIPIDKLDTSVPSVADYLKIARVIDGKYILGGIKTDLETNTIADMYAAGENTYTSRVMQFDTGLKIDLSGLTEGLSFAAVYGLDYSTSYNTSINDEYATYQATWSKFNGVELISGLDKSAKNDKHSGVKNIGGSASNMLMSANIHFDYVRSFDDHNINAIVLVNGDQLTKSGTYHNDSECNFGAQVNYNFARKYFLNAGLSVMHTAKLHEDNRNHLSKSVEVGVDLARHSFLEGGLFDKLLVSAAVSSIKTDLNVENFYLYSGKYESGAWWSWGDKAGGTSVYAAQGGNPDLDPQSRNEFSVNLKAELFNRSLKVDASFYKNTYEGLIIKSDNKVPSYFQEYYPNTNWGYNMNFNEDERIGFDANVNYQKLIGEVELGLGAFVSYYKTEATKRDEIREYSWQYRQGHDVDGNWGYECLGIFQSQEDIDNYVNEEGKHVSQGASIKPGDLKYKDQNNDGVIDSKDEVFLSRGGWYGSPTTLGVNITAKYKNFTLHVVGTGGFGGVGYKNHRYVNGNRENIAYWCPKNDQRYSKEMRNAWTPETAATATLPRLTSGDNANNTATSDFWEYKTNRFDIAKVQLTYDFSKDLFADRVVKGAQVYVSGSNLLTISKEKDYLDLNLNAEPNKRFFNAGVKVTF